MEELSANVTEIHFSELFHTQEEKDPLRDVDIGIENSTYYRINETVFAESLRNINENGNAVEGDEGIHFVDNVMVLRRAGKRHKYLMDIDSSSATLKCPQTDCNKTFSTMTLLRAHVRKVHCAQRDKYMCEHCSSCFAAKYLLERHMVVHTREKVECPVCRKMLSKRTSLSVHLRAHAGARPHECGACGRAFARRGALDAHVRFVHAARPLRCRRCGER